MKSYEKKSLFWGSILILLIVSSPYLLYIHNLIPDDVENYETIFGVIKGGYFELAHVYVYMIFNKFVPLFLLSILYITMRRWWANAILIPIAVYLFQLISILNDDAKSFDKIEYIYTIPILVIVLLALYVIRNKIAIYLEAIDLKKQMDSAMEKQKKH